MSIVVCAHDADSHVKIRNIAQISVLIVLTGQDAGLSAPITFDTIATKVDVVACNKRNHQAARASLETAVDFFMALEAREDAAFRPQPDLISSTATNPDDGESSYGDWCQFMADSMGYFQGPLTGPSSQWVNMNKFPSWTGYGAGTDVHMMSAYEAQKYRSHDCHCRCNYKEDSETVLVMDDFLKVNFFDCVHCRVVLLLLLTSMTVCQIFLALSVLALSVLCERNNAEKLRQLTASRLVHPEN